MRPRVLMLTHRLPYPPDRGDRIRSWQVLQYLAKHADVHLAAVHDHDPAPDQVRQLERHTAALSLQRIRQPAANLRALVALATGQAATPAVFYRRELSKTILDEHAWRPFDAIYTFCTGMLPYAADVLARCDPARRPRHVLDLVDIDSAKWAAYAAQHRGPRRWVYAAEARRLRPLEAGLTCPVDALVVVAQREADLHAAEVARPDSPPLHIIPNGVTLTPTLSTVRGAKRLISDNEIATRMLFVGVLDYPPNVEAVTRFARETLPRIRQHIPEACFDIVGRDPAPSVRELAALPGVNDVGPVDDLTPHYAEADVVVVPLAIARGLQNKVLEALAHGLPTVCSPQAAAGLGGARLPLVIADGPDAFANACVELLSDAERRDHLTRAGLDHVATHYNWNDRLTPLRDLLLPAQHSTPHQRLAA